ncbi:MAG: DUF2225 domain-containing protein [Dehalococcoidia bacterium]
MSSPLPESYRRLSPYAVRYAAGTLLYEQGAVPRSCHVVLRGLVQFEALDHDGAPAVVASAGEGDLVGHVAAFTGRPTSAAARAAEETVVISVPLSALPTAFRDAPELALQLIHAFASPDDGAARRAASAVVEERPVEPTPGPETPADPSIVRVEDEFDAELFFVDRLRCPVSQTSFEYLRVRTRAVRPVSRDSDFFVHYRALDPARYSVVVCPGCAYAAYQEDFLELSAEECEALRKTTAERSRLMERLLTGTRSVADTVAVTDLALLCYAQRRANERRRAALLHRRAWIAREQGDAETERRYLEAARDAYRHAFERDAAITDESAMRAAYLIGDLTLRLGDPVTAGRWLETATRLPAARHQTGLVRMARERLYEARLAHEQSA